MLALSLFAAVGSLLPGSHAAAAAPIPASESATELHLDVEQVKPKPVLTNNAGVVDNTGFERFEDGKTYYGFRLRATDGQLQWPKAKITYTYALSSTGIHVGGGGKTVQLTTVDAPSYRTFDITCEPPIGTYCTAAFGIVETSNGVSIHFANYEDGQYNIG